MEPAGMDKNIVKSYPSILYGSIAVPFPYTLNWNKVWLVLTDIHKMIWAIVVLRKLAITHSGVTSLLTETIIYGEVAKRVATVWP